MIERGLFIRVAGALILLGATTALSGCETSSLSVNIADASIQTPPEAGDPQPPTETPEPTQTAILVPYITRTPLTSRYRTLTPTLTKASVENTRIALYATPTANIPGTLTARAQAGIQSTVVPVATHQRR